MMTPDSETVTSPITNVAMVDAEKLNSSKEFAEAEERIERYEAKANVDNDTPKDNTKIEHQYVSDGHQTTAAAPAMVSVSNLPIYLIAPPAQPPATNPWKKPSSPIQPADLDQVFHKDATSGNSSPRTGGGTSSPRSLVGNANTIVKEGSSSLSAKSSSGKKWVSLSEVSPPGQVVLAFNTESTKKENAVKESSNSQYKKLPQNQQRNEEMNVQIQQQATSSLIEGGDQTTQQTSAPALTNNSNVNQKQPRSLSNYNNRDTRQSNSNNYNSSTPNQGNQSMSNNNAQRSSAYSNNVYNNNNRNSQNQNNLSTPGTIIPHGAKRTGSPNSGTQQAPRRYLSTTSTEQSQQEQGQSTSVECSAPPESTTSTEQQQHQYQQQRRSYTRQSYGGGQQNQGQQQGSSFRQPRSYSSQTQTTTGVEVNDQAQQPQQQRFNRPQSSSGSDTQQVRRQRYPASAYTPHHSFGYRQPPSQQQQQQTPAPVVPSSPGQQEEPQQRASVSPQSQQPLRRSLVRPHQHQPGSSFYGNTHVGYPSQPNSYQSNVTTPYPQYAMRTSTPDHHLQHQQMMMAAAAAEYARQALRVQIEYYFSLENLVRDIYLRAHMDDHGWIDLAFIASFNRVRYFSTDLYFIATCLLDSPIIEVREQGSTGNTPAQAFYVRKRGDWQAWCFAPELRAAYLGQFEKSQGGSGRPLTPSTANAIAAQFNTLNLLDHPKKHDQDQQ